MTMNDSEEHSHLLREEPTYQHTTPVNPYEPPTDYGIPPIPPPPPSPVRRKWWYVVVPILMIVALIATIVIPNTITSPKQPTHTSTNHLDPGGTAAAQAGATQEAADTATANAPTPTPTPLLTDEQKALLSPDFSTFVLGFSSALNSNDFATVRQNTDTTNFVQDFIAADYGNQTHWNTTYQELTGQKLNLSIATPPQTATPNSGNACNYGAHGAYGTVILAYNIQYVMGSYIQIQNNQATNTNFSAVYGFEQKQQNGPWLWWGVFLNGTSC
jgi:hypothetical protein